MDSFLITGGAEEKRKEKALEFAKIHQISNFDTLLIEPAPSGSIGITEIRNLKTKLNLKPFNSNQKLAVLLNFEKATPEAQNAFLKSLEEPPPRTIIVLTSLNTDLLLPTLVSRCQIIQLPITNYQLPTDEFSIFSFQFSVLLERRVGESLKLAQDIGKNREGATLWLEKMILGLRQRLLETVLENKNHPLISRHLNFLISFQKTHALLSTTNVNPRFTLETLFLSL